MFREIIDILQAFGTSLAPLTRELKRLWSSDEDDVVRLHSELALIEIQESFLNSFHEQQSFRKIL